MGGSGKEGREDTLCASRFRLAHTRRLKMRRRAVRLGEAAKDGGQKSVERTIISAVVALIRSNHKYIMLRRTSVVCM